MLSKGHFLTALLLAMGMSVVGAWEARSEAEADLALVLAVDVSFSMEKDEQELQRQGFIEAFRAPEVHEAIRDGMLGRIAVMYVEWAGASFHEVLVPWTLIEQPSDALGFAAHLAQSSTHRVGYTSISGAIDYSVGQLRLSGVQSVRQVIDISGDGANNQGRTVTLARDEALAQGITINGLPIMLNRPDSIWDIANLDLYYRDCVIGGPGAFMIPVREKYQFVSAIKNKIIREIAARPQPQILVQHAQAAPSANCLAGEIRTRE